MNIHLGLAPLVSLLAGILILIIGAIILAPVIAAISPLLALYAVGWVLVKWLDRAPASPKIPPQTPDTPPRGVAEDERPPSSGPSRTR